MNQELNIVIPCYNRIDLLEKTLLSLRNLDIKYPITLVFDGEIIPKDFLDVASKYNVLIISNGGHLGVDENTYYSIMLYDLTLVMDSDVEVLIDFTDYISKTLKLLDNYSGISIADIYQKYNTQVNSLMIKKTNTSNGTVYNKSHIKRAHTLFQDGTYSALDSASSFINAHDKKYFIASPIVFCKHLGVSVEGSTHNNLIFK